MRYAFGVSSNGRTRDFGSLYHGSNPCAPTKIKQCLQGAFFYFAIRHELCKLFNCVCTAKRYQRFVRVSENHRFPKTLVGTSPLPCVRPNHS